MRNLLKTFTSLFRASDDSGDRSPWGSFWFNPVPFRAGGGNVSGDTALQLTSVYSCVRIAAETFGMLPLVVYKHDDAGNRTILRKHWLSTLFNRRPNEFQTPFEFKEMMQGHLELRGNAFAVPTADSKGVITDLIPVHPDRVQVQMISTNDWVYRVKNLDQTTTTYARGELFHVKSLSPDGVLGYNPITLAQVALSSAAAAQDFNLNYYVNDGKPSGVIEMPGQLASDEQRRLFRNRWQEQQTGRNRHKVAILEFGMQFKPIAINRQDAQFLEDRKYSRSEIAGMFRIPAHMINDLEKATFSNIEQLDIGFAKHSMAPRLGRWESALQNWFLSDPDVCVEFPLWPLMQGDAQSRSTYYHNGILDGWLTRNEARAREHYNPIAGLDEPLRPLNMMPESEATAKNAQDLENAKNENAAHPNETNDNEDTNGRDN